MPAIHVIQCGDRDAVAATASSFEQEHPERCVRHH